VLDAAEQVLIDSGKVAPATSSSSRSGAARKSGGTNTMRSSGSAQTEPEDLGKSRA